ncbi:hypothetical protein DNK47_02125 [Mycoplasma wenyonii]|uniref:Lipoprotein n=1 Tax=Mycoplasma wenyonii TaxID=65123 RepID=A0A328PJJ0_9MOLU|nr:hypothetical protein [Mycoplasma wenyonii]RAO94992.1 hypothetical protein DNK47_02125 [Mycoplasma wenyonii]
MLGGNRLLQGLAFGIVGCAMVPLTKSSFFAGGGISSTGTTTTQIAQEEGTQVTVPKRDTFAKLLLAGTNAEDGLVAELTREDKEDSQWKLQKTTWKGQNWNSRWTLYSDDTNGEYTFTDRSPWEWGSGCWGYARYWGRNKVCEAYGRVKQGEETKWKNNFPKIKFDGWTTRLRGGGFSTSTTLDNLSNCTLSIKENKSKDDTFVTVTMTCKKGSMVKILKFEDFERIALEKH